MIIEIHYTALHFDNYQGSSGRPFAEKLLRVVDDEATLAEVHNFADNELEAKAEANRNRFGNYQLVRIVINTQ